LGISFTYFQFTAGTHSGTHIHIADFDGISNWGPKTENCQAKPNERVECALQWVKSGCFRAVRNSYWQRHFSRFGNQRKL